MEDHYQRKAGEHWQTLGKLSFVLGYFKAELMGKGYTSEQLDELEENAIKAYSKSLI